MAANDPANKRARNRQPMQTTVLHKPDPDTALLLKQIGEKCTILIRQVHNLNVEVQSLKLEQSKLRSAVLVLLSDPDAIHEAAAVARSLRIETYSQK